MFEARVLNLLRTYLGEYVRNIPEEALKISVWQGDVVLKDLELKSEALNALKLPITVKAGFLGSVRLKILWNKLGQEPVIVLLDRIFLLAEPASFDNLYQGEDDESARQEAKRRSIEQAEIALLEAKEKKRAEAAESNTWLGNLISTIIGNLKISFTNVHIRYEDTLSNPERPFCTGLTLAKLAAVTIDEKGVETFVTAGALDKLRKAVHLDRLALYHDSDAELWEIGKKWDRLTSSEWSQIFEPGIANDGEAAKPRGQGRAAGRQYLLHPVGGTMRYQRLGKADKRAPDVPFQKAGLVLDEVALTMSESQYGDAMKLLEAVATFRKKAEVARFRPRVPVLKNARKWWKFAQEAYLYQKNKFRRKINWSDVYQLCQMRRKYVELYAKALEPGLTVADTPEIRKMDAQLSNDVILLWRMLAHATAERTRPKQDGSKQNPPQRGWIGWLSGRPIPGANKGEGDGRHGLSQEEWDKLDELVSYEPGMESPLLPGQEAPNMLQIAVDVMMKRNTAKALDAEGNDVLCGSFDNFQLGVKIYPKMMKADVSLAYYGLSAPEGCLIKSVSRQGREGALTASYVQSPLEQNLDWILQATISSSHVTVWRASVDRFVKFLKSGQAVSPGVALETAAVLQSKLEDVQRQAKVQLQQALQQRSRFSIDLDLDAPKISIPVDADANGSPASQLLLDLGHFTLKTDQDEPQERLEDSALYTKFKVTGTDISIFLADGEYDWSQPPPLQVVKAPICPPSTEKGKFNGPSQPASLILPVLDRCGMSALLQQMMVTLPGHPTTRIAVWLPRLGFHFSPARFGRMMKVLRAVLPAKTEENESKITVEPSWLPGDFSGPLWDLNWAGMGSTTATWEPRWAVLNGSYLYILENENAKEAKKEKRLVGKTILEIPPELIGNTRHVVAICSRGKDPSMVIRSQQALVLRFKSNEDLSDWMDRMVGAMYLSSAPATLSVIDDDEEKDEMPSSTSTREPVDSNQPLVYILGALDQLELSVGGLVDGASTSDEELDILVMRASGGKVELLQRQSDLAIGMGVHEFELEDLLQGPVNPSARYMARSLLTKPQNEASDPAVAEAAQVLAKKQDIGGSSPARVKGGKDHEDEDFTDAEQEFPGSPDSMSSTPRHSRGGIYKANLDIFFDAEELALEDVESSLDAQTPSFGRVGYLLPGGQKDDGLDHAVDFVKVQLLMRQQASPEYDGTDMKMIITMSTLEFFMIRPTVAALMDLGSQLSRASASDEAGPTSNSAAKEKPLTVAVNGLEGLESSVVKGLLGRGKSKVIFQLYMNMEVARVFLTLEDGSHLAMLEQERMSMDFKLFPGSMRISVSLGNLRFCNMLLGPTHQWGWLCDLRDPSNASLVQLEFTSFSPDDDDYEGYEYSLSGQLSAVRIVFLYRFISELTAYFMALAAPGAQQAVIRVVDAVGGIERFIQQSEMTGSPGVKLAISLDAPLIIMPHTSTSSDFMQISLGHLQVSSNVEWRGGNKEDPSAVRVDMITIESRDINVRVGIKGTLREPMVPQMEGLKVTVQRSLRDLFKRVPTMEVHIEMARLRAVLSDREYTLITGCALANMAEPPQLPSDFRKAQVAAIDKTEKEEIDEEEPKPKAPAEPYTTMRVSVDLHHAELELFSGYHRDTSLALLRIQGLWLNYLTTSHKEMNVLLTLTKMSILDRRAGTRPEMRLALGSALDADPTRSSGLEQGWFKDDNPASLTMIVMNMISKPGTQSIVVRIQRPRMLVALDFLLDVGGFFVPSIGAMAGKETSRDVREDPVGLQHDVLLKSASYKQTETLAWISPQRQLVADTPSVDDYEYDGCGNTLYLLEDESGIGLSGPPSVPFIRVGVGKKLRFKNVTILNGLHLDSCVYLASGSCYSAAVEDGVILDGSGVDSGISSHDKETSADTQKGSQPASKAASSNFSVDFQAIAPELTFYDSTTWPANIVLQPEKLLRAKLDLNLLLAMRGPDTWLKASAKGVMVENAAGLAVLEPLDAIMDYVCEKGQTKLDITSTDIALHIPLNVVRLMQRLSADLSAALKLGGGPIVTRCTQFDRLWQSPAGSEPSQDVTFWRPLAKTGYSIVGDCVTLGKNPPLLPVVAVNPGYRRTRRPRNFKLLWSSKGIAPDEEECCIWLPIAAQGYVALGCLVTKGRNPPDPTTAACVREDLLTSSSAADCVFFDPDTRPGDDSWGPASIWRVDNSVQTFFACQGISQPPHTLLRDFRPELLIVARMEGMSSDNTSSEQATLSKSSTMEQSRLISAREPTMLRSSRLQASTPAAPRPFLTTPHFERIWWDKGGPSKRHVTIWRPQAPTGYTILGDTASEGYDPPDAGLVVLDDTESSNAKPRLAKPVEFVLRATLSARGWEEARVWFPVAPPGYVALGCVVAMGAAPPSTDCVRCLRTDLVNQKNFAGKAVWSWSPAKNEEFSFWPVDNQPSTFVVHADNRKPPWRMAYSLAELEKPKQPDNLDAQIKTPRVSITVFDDFSGVLTPLMDMSITKIHLTVHGRPEALNAFVFTSAAASTYNTQLGVWEPLIEPFDGTFKYESREDAPEGLAALGGATHVRIQSTTVLNVNVSSAAIDSFANASLTWSKTAELEQAARRILQQGRVDAPDQGEGSAVDREEGLRLMVENQLGASLYARTAQDGFQSVQRLSSGHSTILPLPPLLFPELLRTSPADLQTRGPRRFIALRIKEAKDLVSGDDVSDQDYVCLLTMLTSEVSAAQQTKQLPQTARTRGVRALPSESKDKGVRLFTAVWNEVFVFEVPAQGNAKLDLRIINQAANAGKGSEVGSVVMSMDSLMGRGPNDSNWNAVKAALAIGHTSWRNTKEKELTLMPPLAQISEDDVSYYGGHIVISDYAFIVGVNGHVQTPEALQQEAEQYQATDAVIELSPSPDGPWTGMRTMTAIMTVPITLDSKALAVEMSMRQGLKCLTLRSLAVLSNSADMMLDVCICPSGLLSSEDTAVVESVEDETYENQRFSPLLGWGSAWPGHLLPSDPARYSSRDLSTFSQEISNKAPTGWEYVDNWQVDRSLGDSEGWFYGTDFKSLKGPVSAFSTKSKKSPFDFVRRRRLVRTRERQSGGSLSSLKEQGKGDGKLADRLSLGVLEPGGCLSLPWSSLLPGSDWCLQLRPHDEERTSAYKWSQVVPPASEQGNKSKGNNGVGSTGKQLLLSDLMTMKEVMKREELLECSSAHESFWLCIEADPSRLYSDMNSPVTDWRLTVRAPLKLENRLPCVSECIVWEKAARLPIGAGSVRRQHALVNAGEAVHVYSADIRNQLMLTWLPQGAWKHEKDAVLISDPWAASLPGFFWIANALSKRRLRVSLENDMGATEVSAKIVRLFVPYWVLNDTAVPLYCRLAEIEPFSGQNTDSLWLQLASKAAKNAAQLPAQIKEGPSSVANKVIRSLGALENLEKSQPVMLSLPSMDNVGLSVALNPDGVFDKAIALKAFEDKIERVELYAINKDDGSYIKLSVMLDMSTLGYERTKVIRFQPHTTFKNLIGQNMVIRQVGGVHENLLAPTDPDRSIYWESKWQPELLQIRIDGCEWSRPFSVDVEGVLYVIMRKSKSEGSVTLRADVQNGVNVSRFSVLFRLGSQNLPYKIENRSSVLPIRFRQIGTDDSAWELLNVGCALPFAWVDIKKQHLLEVMVDGAGPNSAQLFNIDEEAEHEPKDTDKGPVAALRFVVKRDFLGNMCVRISDWRPSSDQDDWAASSSNLLPGNGDLTGSMQQGGTTGLEDVTAQKKFYLLLELDEFGISIVDQTPEELLYISMHGAFLAYDANVSGLSRIKVRVGHLQIDNQLPLTAMPVLLAPMEANGSRQDYVLKLTITSESKTDEENYPYIGLQLPSEAWLVNIHEPIIWRFHTMIGRLNLGRLSSNKTTAVAVDPLVAIRLLNISESRIKLTLAMAPSQRPRGILGFWSTLITSLGNTDEMLIHLKQKVFTDIQMRKSQVSGAAASAISHDLLSQPFQLLSGLDFLGNASSALGNFSEGVAALSMDKAFIRSRQTQESKGTIEGFGDGLREGGEALAKGLFRGFTGILTKPVEGAQESGVEGFMSGVGKGIVGVAAQPVSGVLDFVGKTADGVNASRMKLSAAISAKAALKRNRLPRAVGGDNILKPFDEYAARGQIILQLAERGALFGASPFDIKERSKYALSDAYETHFNLPGKRTFMITNQRCMLLQHPSGGIAGKRPDLLKEPCSIMWDISWDELMATELKSGKEDPPSSPPSRLMLHLREWSQDSRLFDTKKIMRMVQCHPGTTQATEIQEAVQLAQSKYGPDRATVAALMKSRRAESRPYTGAGAGAASGAALGLLAFPAAPIVIPVMATFGAIVGGAGQVMLESESEEVPRNQAAMASSSERAQSSRRSPTMATSKKGSYEQAGQIIRSFKRVWWDKGALWSQKYPVSIWRPVPPPGFVSVGDLAIAGYDQPEKAMVYRDDGNGKFAPPEGFNLIWRDADGGAKTPVTVWMPRPPAGYVALGCVAEPNNMEPDREVVRCVRRDCAAPAEMGKLIWRDRKGVALWKCSLWAVMNDGRTFLARRDHDSPSPDQCFTVQL